MTEFSNNTSLRLLRAIAKATTPITAVETAAGDLALLAIEDGLIDVLNVFMHACRDGHTEVVRLILDLPLERGVDPTARDNEALRHASLNGNTEIVRLLLALPPDRGVNLSARDNEALRHACVRHACYHGHTEIVRMLLAAIHMFDDELIRFARWFVPICYYTEIGDMLNAKCAV